MAASLLTLRTLDGDVAELHVEPGEHIYRVAQRLAELKKPGEKVFARLVHEGQPLPPGSKVGDHDLAEVDAVWCKWTPPEKFGNSSNEVLPRRQLNVKELHADSGRLDISGTFTKPGYDRLQLAIDLPTAAFGLGLRVLDLRQCGLAPESLLTIFEKLPSSLEELWASRNHFSLRVLQCLQQKALQLRALDVGYSECDICTPLPDLVCEKTEELILGDLNDLLPETFAATLAKCPFLRSLDICSCWRLLGSFGAIAALPELRRLKSQRVDVDEEGVNQVLRSCTQLEHLYLERVSSSGSIQLLAKLENLKVFAGQVATGDLGNQLICEICQLKVETLLICPGLMAEDEDEPSTALSENVGPLVQALKNCVAGCIAVEASSVDPAVLEAVGCRLCRMDNGLSSGSFSLISSLLEMKHCCTNLLSLSVNYWEQIDGKQFAQLVAACPLLQIVHLNADDCGFQISPIDEGILALGQHCHQLEHLDMYDRIMKAAAVPSPAGQHTVAGLSSAVSSARSQGAMGMGQTVAGLSSGISSARSQALGGHAQTLAGLSSSISSGRSQVDGALLADAILSKEKVKEDDANSWDEEGGDEPEPLPTLAEEKPVMSIVPPAASVAPPVAPVASPVAPPVASIAPPAQDAGQRDQQAESAGQAKISARDRQLMDEFGFEDEPEDRDRADSSDWDA